MVGPRAPQPPTRAVTGYTVARSTGRQAYGVVSLRSRKARRVRVEVGGRQFTKVGVRPRDWRDAYHLVLGLNWPVFFLIVVTLFVLTNLLFAWIYLLQPGAVAHAHGFVDEFFFSIETLSTVGYGEMYPLTLFAQAVASVEIVVGLIGVATMTGLVFVRFSRPRARILFSKFAVIGRFNGVPTLMVRMANERHNMILEADVRLTLIRLETTAEGAAFRRQHDLRLDRHHSAAFALSWTVMHPIDARSPLDGVTAEALARSQAFLTVSVSGLDDILDQTVHARGVYTPDQVLFGKRYVDILVPQEGHTILDLTRFHETEADHDGH